MTTEFLNEIAAGFENSAGDFGSPQNPNIMICASELRRASRRQALIYLSKELLAQYTIRPDMFVSAVCCGSA
eukprot:SAG31_NODE_23424_length_504_cov_1.795062_1_plen_71_part_10